MKGQVTSLFWKVNKPATPLIKIVTSKDDIYKALNRKTRVRVANDYGKKCIGYYENGGFHPCPEKKRITYGRQCESCKSKNEFLKCAKCKGIKCTAGEERREKCKQTHFLYLTSIGGKLKVGITRAGRYLKRWIEQGSDYACILNSGDGKVMRREEYKLSKNISDRMRTSFKLEHYLEHDKEILQKFLKTNEYNNNPIINVREYYPGINSIPSEPLKYEGKINGRIVSAKGKVLVFEKDETYYFYNMNNLLGHEVKIKVS